MANWHSEECDSYFRYGATPHPPFTQVWQRGEPCETADTISHQLSPPSSSLHAGIWVSVSACVCVCVFPPTLNRETVKKDASWAWIKHFGNEAINTKDALLVFIYCPCICACVCVRVRLCMCPLLVSILNPRGCIFWTALPNISLTLAAAVGALISH